MENNSDINNEEVSPVEETEPVEEINEEVAEEVDEEVDEEEVDEEVDEEEVDEEEVDEEEVDEEEVNEEDVDEDDEEAEPVEESDSDDENKSILNQLKNSFKFSKDNNQMNLYRSVVSLIHSAVILYAIYLSFKCNNGFHLGAFLLACMCPYIYILYAGATNGFCMVTKKSI